MFFCCSIYIETAQNSREECNEFLYLLFWRLSLCLSRDSLSCDTHSLDLCILFTFIFLYLLHIPPHSFAFHTFYFTPMFSYVYYHAKYFSYSWWRCCSEFYYYFFLISAVKGLIWTAFFFLTFIVLIQWNLPWNIVPTRPYLPTKLQCVLLLFDTSESLECAKVVVLKLGAILFYSGIHFKSLKLWKKKKISRRSE